MTSLLNDRLAQDRDLARRVVAGEAAAFEAFFSEYFERLYRFALPRVGFDAAACEDIVQTVLIRALERLASYRGEAALFTWLCTLCRNAIVDARRRGDLPDGRTSLIDDQPEVRALLDALAATAADGALDGPERSASGRQVADLVRALLDHLPARYGDALEWKYALGLSTAEIAARLGISEKATESLLARAKQAFREGIAGMASLDDLLWEPR